MAYEPFSLEDLRKLKSELTRHDYRYYILFDPMISDQEYDRLYKFYQDQFRKYIGMDTRSLETEDQYPQWVRDEFKGVKPRA